MSNVTLMEEICAWFETQICSKYEFLVPDDELNDEEYQVQFAHPAVYPYFVPTEDMDMPKVPSLCVQILETEEKFAGASTGQKIMKMRLLPTLWNPGTQVIFEPKEDAEALGGVTYTADTSGYERNLDGWKEYVNFQDDILRRLKADEFVEGVHIDLSSIRYGMFKGDQDDIYVFYPYWTGYIDFTATMGATRLVPKKYEDIL